MSVQSYDIVVIGGGIIGLSTAMHILKKFPDARLVVLEKDKQLAGHQTSHNSGVIHSGIYYKPGSLKAEFCVQGRDEMVRFCDQNGIDYERCGKVVLATEETQLEGLQTLFQRGKANGVKGLEIIGPERLKEIEPFTTAVRALWAPNTSIVNYRQVAHAYARLVADSGGEIRTSTKLVKTEKRRGLTYLMTTSGDIETKYTLNCAGLYADTVAKIMGIASGVRIIPFRGEYYRLSKQGRRLIRGLVYPVPNPRFPFLGVHFTKNVNGYVEAGPNAVLATAREGYRKRDVNLKEIASTVSFPGFWRMSIREWRTGFMEINRSLRKSVFVDDLRKMVPLITSADLVEGGSGVRAQAVDKSGKLLDDFAVHQSENSIHVLNAPSPGATSSLTIGRHLAELASRNFLLC
mgnify:FL=1